MKRTIRAIFSVVVILSVSTFYAQEKKQQKADELYRNYAYIDAIKIYERIAEKGYINQSLLENLGNAYYFNADYKSALKWYDQLFKMKKDNDKMKIQPELYYRYAQSLKTEQRYDEANKVLDLFSQMSSDNKVAKLYMNNKNYLQKIKNNSDRFSLTSASINTQDSEYGVAFYGDDAVVYTASKRRSWGRRFRWSGSGYYNLYKANRESENLVKGKEFSSNLNTSVNESTATFSKDLNTVYFTRNNSVNGKVKTDSQGNILLKIFKAERKNNGKWADPVELPFNSDSYSVAHPALSPDGKYLYFASDMKGTLGHSDIFRVAIKSNGTYGAPENLGAKINTELRESFPFVSDDNILYFSSEGLPGLGGLDIFAVKIKDDGSLGALENIGRPGNSPADDFAYVIDSKKKVGFLSSNRPGGKGKDDIYGFVEKRALEFSEGLVKVKGVVKDAQTMQVLSGVEVTLADKRMKDVETIYNKSNGEFDFGSKEVNSDDDYIYIRAKKDGYTVLENRVAIDDKEALTVELLLQPNKKEIKVNDDLAKFFKIENIYFDFDKFDIRRDAAVDLAKIVEVMKQYPTLRIAINSHTDSRGSKAYNMKLSEKRAQATKAWIVKQGISADRIQTRGYGESQLINKCKDGVPCSTKAHQQNRRSEFIILQK